MSNRKPEIGSRRSEAGGMRLALSAICLLASVLCALAAYTLQFTPPLPADTNGSLSGYQGAWQYTNTLSTNTWFFFAQVPTGSTRLTINGTVGSPAWLIVRSLGTNGLLSTNLTRILYDTNMLAATLTNNLPVIPAGPTVFVITNN